MLILMEAIEQYLIPYLNAQWEYHQSDNAGGGKRFPLAVEEASLNTAFTGSIYQYLAQKCGYTSTLVSEAGVERAGGVKNGRCDLVLFTDETVYYIELKGVLFSIGDAGNYLDIARRQVFSIIDDDILKKYNGRTSTEFYYGYTPRKRVGLIAGLVFAKSGEDGSKSNYSQIKDELSELEILQKKTDYEPFVHEFKCKSGASVDVSYYDSKFVEVPQRSNGFFLVGAEFEI